MSTRSADKPEILILVDWFEPAFLAGGPVQSVSSLVHYLGDSFRFKIFTGNSDLDNIPFHSVKADCWIRKEKDLLIYYASRRDLNGKVVRKLLNETACDVVYINSFFSKFFSIVPLLFFHRSGKKKKVVLAPRGMLGQGALAIKSAKKKLFIFYARLLGLHRSIVWHATSDEERIEIRRIFPQASIAVIPNIPKALTSMERRAKSRNSLRIFFMSRISRKKNLLFALTVLQRLKCPAVEFHIYGPVEDQEYWNQCQQLISTLPANVTVEYKGTVRPEGVENVLRRYHLAFLPTLNENYGHSIVESLLSGCPVLISDQTPWSDVESSGAGFAYSLSQPDSFVKAIEKLNACDEEEFTIYCRNAGLYIRKKIDLEKIIGQYKNLFYECAEN